jgi:electron transfer flavoprotein alpha subunit
VPTARILLGAVAAKLEAVVIGSVRGLAVEGDSVIAGRSAADEKVVERIETQSALAVIFDGADVDIAAAQPVPVERKECGDAAGMRLLETLEPESSGGLLTAARVVGVGAGVASKDDVALIEELAQAMQAEMACSLPVCDDLRWMPTARVVGSSHSQISPELYIAVGISGQPQHLAGVRDAKIIVGVNSDPEARIFKNCNYGIVGDLYKIVPALTAAFKNLD